MGKAEKIVIDTVRGADRDRYLSALYAPQDKREALFALYAFNAEIAGVRERIHEPMPGEIRLQWWRDVLSANDPLAAASGHPLAEAMARAIAAYDLPRPAFDNYLEARIFDLYDDPMPSRTELEGYCGETASVLIQLAAMVLDREAAPAYAELAGRAGCAQAMTGLLLLLPRHRAFGQCFVPADILSAVGTSRDEFLAAGGGDGAARAVSAMIALAREHLAAFEAGASALPASLRPAFLPLALTGAYLDRLEQAGAAVLNATPCLSVPPRLSALRRHWLLYRRASKGWGSTN